MCRIASAVMIVLVACSQGLAGWCGDFTNSIFCDDFDRYCLNPPPSPQSCPEGSPRDDSALRSVWEWTSYNWNTQQSEGVNAVIEEDTRILTTPPYGARHANGGDEGSRLGQNTVDLTPYIEAVSDYTAVPGMDMFPLILTFNIASAARLDALPYCNGYIELGFNDDGTGGVNDEHQAPTDWVNVGANESETCFSCFGLCSSQGHEPSGTRVPWPSICQSYEPRVDAPACPPLQTHVRYALAVGALAMLDNDPCHCDTPDSQVPRNYHVSFYDGLKWRILKSNRFPGNGGDFVWGDKVDTIILTIKSSTVEIYHRGRVNGTWVESTATEVPRQYLGPFNRLRMGTKEGCMLRGDSYACDPAYANGKKRPTRMGDTRCDGGGWQSNRSKFVSFDSVRLHGSYIPYGACCLADGTCAYLSKSACLAGGGRWQGSGSRCEFVNCCPYPFADGDGDGDVDQDDFGVFQLCFTGDNTGVPVGCGCFDRNNDSRIDGADLISFRQCFTAPNVPWTAALTPDCTP